MRLILLRHAKTEKAEAGQRDHTRRLNARGRDDAPMVGAYMARHGLVPDRALVSSATRTRETWERVAGALAARPQVIHEERLYDASSDAILTLVRETEPRVRSEEHTSELQSLRHLVCRLLLEKKKLTS